MVHLAHTINVISFWNVRVSSASRYSLRKRYSKTFLFSILHSTHSIMACYISQDPLMNGTTKNVLQFYKKCDTPPVPLNSHFSTLTLCGLDKKCLETNTFIAPAAMAGNAAMGGPRYLLLCIFYSFTFSLIVERPAVGGVGQPCYEGPDVLRPQF